MSGQHTAPNVKRPRDRLSFCYSAFGDRPRVSYQTGDQVDGEASVVVKVEASDDGHRWKRVRMARVSVTLTQGRLGVSVEEA